MQGKISMDLSFCQAENGYSLDELVQKLANCFEQKAFSELLRLILQMTQELLLHRILHGKSDAMKCCPQGHLSLNGGFERRIRTTLGEFKMTFMRVRCSRDRRYQTKTNELEKLVVEAASSTNYRRAVKELAGDGKIPLSFHTAHGWVMKTDCDEIQLSSKAVGSAPIQIMPDGTGFKGEGKKGEARKGDLKVVIGVTTHGEIFPLGAKAGVSWQEINENWKKKRMKFPE